MSTSNSGQGTSTTQSVGFAEAVRAVLRGAPLAILAVLAAGILSVLINNSLPPTYQASASVLASRPPSSFNNLNIITPPQVDPSVYQRLLLDGQLVHDALLRLDNVNRSSADMMVFMRKIDVAVENQDVSAIIHIQVKDQDPVRAADYANAIAGALIAWDRGRAWSMVENSISALERSIEDIDSEIARAVGGAGVDSQRQQAMAATLREQRVRELEAARTRSASAVMVGLLEVLSPARPPVEAIGPRLVFNTFVAVVLAGLLAYGAQLVVWSISNRVSTRAQLEGITSVPVLAVIRKRRGAKRGMSGEAVNFFRAKLIQALKPTEPFVVGLTSPAEFADKVGLASLLAESLARSGYRVLVLDADLGHRGPGIGYDYRSPSGPGLEAYLREPGLPLTTTTIRVDQYLSFEALASSGPIRQANELLEFGFRRFVESLSAEFDAVIVDLPPVLKYADALVAAPACSGVVLCMAEGRRAEGITQAMELLESGSARIIGTVLTSVSRLSGGSYPRDRGGRGSWFRTTKSGSSTAAQAPTRPNAVARVRQR